MTQPSRPSKDELAAVSGPAWVRMSDGFAARRLGVVRRLLALGDSMAAVADQLKISPQGLAKFVQNRSNKDGK